MKLRSIVWALAALSLPASFISAAPASAVGGVTDWAALQSAVQGLTVPGDSMAIVLDADISVDSDWLNPPAGTGVWLDLHGHSLSISSPDDYPAIAVAFGSTLEVADSVGGGSLNVIGTLNSPGIGVTPLVDSMIGHIILSGGTITATALNGAPGIGVVATNENPVEVGVIDITGATVSATGNGAAGIGGFGSVEINISNSSVTATGGYEGAGIGSSYNGGSPTISISSSTVVATGGYGSAGIGGAWDAETAYITITDSDITATGGDYGAGVGGGEYTAAGGTVSITGSTVTAIGILQGAGIGTGPDSEPFGSIVIDSSVVNASSADPGAADEYDTTGAAIGGGSGSGVQSIIIRNSSNVVAIAGGGAAIGGGFAADGNDVFIADSFVLATGAHGSAGIGGGAASGSGGDVQIQGCSSVTAASGGSEFGGGAGIGSGYINPYGNPVVSAGTLSITGGRVDGSTTTGGAGADAADPSIGLAGLAPTIQWVDGDVPLLVESRDGSGVGGGGYFRLTCNPDTSQSGGSTDATTGSAARSLATTGPSTMPLAPAAVLLAVLGGVAILVRRRQIR